MSLSSPPRSPMRSRSSSKLDKNADQRPLSPLAQPASVPGPSTPRRVTSNPLHGAASPPPERSKSRAKDLLRKHYGLGTLGPPTPTGRPMDPMDLGLCPSCVLDCGVSRLPHPDSPAFDARAYYEQLITTSSLTALLKKENELLTGRVCACRARRRTYPRPDMRQLDSERQSLVYNHHHELIAATDTISAVRCPQARVAGRSSSCADEDQGRVARRRPRPAQGRLFRNLTAQRRGCDRAAQPVLVAPGLIAASPFALPLLLHFVLRMLFLPRASFFADNELDYKTAYGQQKESASNEQWL
jgi:hypothetical protein